MYLSKFAEPNAQIYQKCENSGAKEEEVIVF